MGLAHVCWMLLICQHIDITIPAVICLEFYLKLTLKWAATLLNLKETLQETRGFQGNAEAVSGEKAFMHV